VRIVIDPGHGGADPGAIGPGGTREADINLAVSSRLAALLIRQRHEVVLTRTGDVFLSLATRADLANSRKADAFVSIHCNAAVSPAAHGFEVWTSRGQTRADALASGISTAWSLEFPFMTIRADWGDGDVDKESGFFVLVKTAMPAVLIELQFISHPQWEKWLNDKTNQDRMAAAIAAGVGAWQTN
jgi:N-acetylmuramoyl-L-alanine amidase